jgi:hypothetical protein
MFRRAAVGLAAVAVLVFPACLGSNDNAEVVVVRMLAKLKA